MPPHPTLFLKKALYHQVGEFDTQFKIAADYDFILRLLSKPGLQIVYIPEVFMLMRQGGASSKWRNLIIKSKEDLRILKKNRIPFPIFVLIHKIASKFKQFV